MVHSRLWLLLLVVTSLLIVQLAYCQDAEEDFEVKIDEDDEVEDVKPVEKKAPVKKEPYKPPEADFAYFSEAFVSEGDFNKRWIKSNAKKDGVDAAISKYDGAWSLEGSAQETLLGDIGLVLKSKAKHHAISAKVDQSVDFSGETVVIQYEIIFQEGQECGGGYLKLLSDSSDLDLNTFHDKTPYTIMFGPDKCGEDKKFHFIFRHKNPKTGQYEEKHAKRPTGDFSGIFDDKKAHLLTLIVRPDNTFEILLDMNSISSGSLLEDFTPSVNPSKEIDDPNDKKPVDWDEREKIPDPEAVKPEDWEEDAPAKIIDADAKKPDGWLDDEPEHVADPNAEKPDDWDTEEDGEWEAPQIPNPKCESAGCGTWSPPSIDNPAFKGKWTAPLIDNPNYKGVWKPSMIPNPDYFEDNTPYKMTPIGAVGIELWSMSNNILFDNIIITNDLAVASKFASDSWALRKATEAGPAAGLVNNLLEATNERPWLWVLVIIAIVLPFILIAACCFPSSKSDAAAEHKKTDEPTPDSPEEENKEEENPGDDTQEEGEGDEEEKEKEEEGEVDEEEANKEEDKEDDAEENQKDAEEAEVSQDEKEEVEDSKEEEVKEDEPETEEPETDEPTKRVTRRKARMDN